MEPGIAEAVLRYLYTFDYADGSDNTQGGFEPLVLDVHMCIAADHLRLEDLEQLAASKFKDRAVEQMHSNEFADAVSVAYTSAPDHKRMLRDSIIRICTQHAKELFGADESNSKRLKELLTTLPAFGGEVAMKLAASAPTPAPAPAKTYQCPHCSYAINATQFTRSTMIQCPGCAVSSMPHLWYEQS